MVASRIVEFPEDLVEEIDVIKGWVEETTTVRYLAGVRGDVRGDLLLPDTDQRDRMVLAGDRCWYFPLPLAFRLGLMYEGPLGKLFALLA
ncbi:hypothetical protein F2Q69_00052221 [Brassica cretica]|uniref:Uncharacterized protein n=1 Tax=Brassica cretica TaxID=69181 RepID=A0A8S9N262_BRACR|nr:hypothetical protein F2Q69_00052221 [Brassica cretica]